MNRPRERAFWAVLLHGNDKDMNVWHNLLQQPYDPIVQQIPHIEGFILRCAEFTEMTSAGEVLERARIIIDDLNGALRVTSGAGRISFNGLAEVMTDGTIQRTAYIEGVHFIEFVSQIAMVTTGGTPSPPGPSLAQKWIQLAATNDIVADMLRHFGNEPSWYDLYKTYEGVQALCEDFVKSNKRPWTPSKPTLTLFRRTANYYRHGLPHEARKNPPSKLMHFDEAREMIRRMVYGIMTDLVP